jgi:hypothetical protein
MRKVSFLLWFLSAVAYGQNKKLKEFQTGDFRLDLKLPYFNHLALHPDRQFRESRFGFIGEGIGVEYSYRQNKFLEASFSLAATSQVPFPAPIDKEYTKSLSSFYFSLTDNVINNRFSLGYGINYSNNIWTEWIRDLSTMTTVRRTEYFNKTLGLTLNTYYRLGKTANVGIIYRPSVFNLGNDFHLLYEHLISLEFNWRFRLFSRKRHD